jgi:hypothetical protein
MAGSPRVAHVGGFSVSAIYISAIYFSAICFSAICFSAIVDTEGGLADACT